MSRCWICFLVRCCYVACCWCCRRSQHRPDGLSHKKYNLQIIFLKSQKKFGKQ